MRKWVRIEMLRTGLLVGGRQGPSLTLRFSSGEVTSWRFLSQHCGSQTLGHREIAKHNSFMIASLYWICTISHSRWHKRHVTHRVAACTLGFHRVRMASTWFLSKSYFNNNKTQQIAITGAIIIMINTKYLTFLKLSAVYKYLHTC